MTLAGLFDYDGHESSEYKELEKEELPLFAPSPGHSVFGEYVGAHWCGPCQSSASPSLHNLKTSNPDDFTYVSFFQGSGTGWPSDSIGSDGSRRNHVMGSSSGYPTFSFADEQAGSCYKVGAGGTNYYDNDFSAGGCMAINSADFSMELGTSLSSSGDMVTTDLSITYLGSIPSVPVYVYAAVTEQSGAENYNNGYKPHNVFRSWLLNSNEDGFEQVVLSPNTPVELSWDEPLNTVRASGGNTQFENFWPVIALMDGPHTTYNNFYAAVDLDMAPLVDIGISDAIIRGNPGFVQGDIIELETIIINNGVESYSDGGEFSIYYLDGADEQLISSTSINNNIAPGATQTFVTNFDTSSIEMSPSGASIFRARLSDLDGDRNPSNNIQDIAGFHDLPPTPITPTPVTSPNVNRGSTIQFEVTAIANDLVDSIETMSPTLQYSESNMDSWDDTWIDGPEIIGNGGNARYVFSINTELTSEIGDYDIRVMWTDAGGQNSDWLISEDAFALQNSLPTIYSSSDNQYSGMPTVRVDIEERVSIIGLINDVETPLQLLEISSNSDAFLSWDSMNLEFSVKFTQVYRDSHGNALPQGIQVTVDDGDDVNSGLILFNVIENGAPRWAPINTQSFDEGGYGSITLTNYLSDTNDVGNPAPVSDLSLSIIDISDQNLVEANLNGHSLSVISLNEDDYGIVYITIRASDGTKFSDTVVTFHIHNVNDAPRINLTDIEEINIQTGDTYVLNLFERISDVDNSDDEIWVVVENGVPGAAQWNPISGDLHMTWQEPGQQVVNITAEDRHGNFSSSTINVNVVDDLPLIWKYGSNGDFTISIDTTDYFTNPSVLITNVGDLELSEISVFWGICNSVTGICHTSGISHNLGPFIVNHISGGGLGIGDYMTFTVRAVDQDGMDRVTEETYKVYATLPEVDTGNEENPVKDDSSSLVFELTPLKIVGILGLGVLSILIISLSTVTILRRREKQALESQYSSHAPIELMDNKPSDISSNKLPPPPPMIPKLPESGLPPGWSMEQWHYYGEEYIRRQK